MGRVLTILGLGPGDPTQRTVEAVQELEAAKRIILRTGIHPGLESLLADARVSTCDDLYQTGRSFDDVYGAIVERVLALATEGELVYAVPGHPLIGERTVAMLLARAREGGTRTRLVPGVSALDAVAAAIGEDLMSAQAEVLDALELERFLACDPYNASLPDATPTRPTLVSQVYSPAIASAVKLTLGRLYPEDHPVRVVIGAGVPTVERVIDCRLFELDRQPVDHLTSVWVPALPELQATRAPATVHRIAALLRAPNGCPWDREQTHTSLIGAVLEEAHEVVDAIVDADADHLAEELGDLLLQVAMHAQIAEEAGDFSIGDVFDHVNRKLVRRHPHVFGNAIARDPEAVVQTWDAVKARERGGMARGPDDPFDRFPRSMPAATKIARIAAERGADTSGSGATSDGGTLLDIVEQMGRAGLDPEREIERAYRARQQGASNGRGASDGSRRG